MGVARHHEDPHAGHGYVPKLMVAGRLTGSVDGCPVVIDADESGIVLTVARFRTAWGLRRSVRTLLPVLGSLKRFGVPLRVRVAGILSLDVLPRVSPLARFIVPGLANLE